MPLSYIGVIAVLLRWRHEHHKSSLPAERFLSALRVGMRFVMHTRELQAVLDPRHRVLRVRELDVVAVSSHRSPRSLAAARKSTACSSLASGYGAVGGAMVLAARTDESFTRRTGRRRERPALRSPPSLSRMSRAWHCCASRCWPPAWPGFPYSRALRSLPRLRYQRGCAPAASPAFVVVVHGRNGPRQHTVGPGRHAYRDRRRAHDFRCRTWSLPSSSRGGSSSASTRCAISVPSARLARLRCSPKRRSLTADPSS